MAERGAEEGWREGYRLLEERVSALPGLLRQALAQPAPEWTFDPRGARRFVLSGVGSSAAHARVLASLLAEAGLAARFTPLSAFLAPPPRGAANDVLIVFSQGLSPNARVALAHRDAWRGVALITAIPEGDRTPESSGVSAEKRRFIAELGESGVTVVRFPGAEEYGTLVRIVGPMTGHVAALRTAASLSPAIVRALDIDARTDDVCAAVAGARDRVDREIAFLDATSLQAGLAFVAGGTTVERIDNLRFKVLEGMMLPLPPAWDLLDFAHGPLQQAFPRPGTFIVLTDAGASPAEADVLSRIAAALDASRHRLVRLTSSLPGPLALLEYEALMNALLLRYVEECRIDQVRWPGRGVEAALYDLGPGRAAGVLDSVPSRTPAIGLLDAASAHATAAAVLDSASRHASGRPAAARRLETLTWPELEDLLQRGCTTAVLPLGSTEQHGPHLPFATDTWIADALADRFCARFPETVRLPAVALGCAREHLAFPGTLSVEAGTLEAVLCDVAASLAKHGFERMFVFSAHGGNEAALREAGVRMQARCPAIQVIAFADLHRVARVLARESKRFGIDTAAAGRHAGESETSIVLGLRPESVRCDRFAAGFTDTELPSADLFYPDLRIHAASGTVGDPRPASAEHAECYLAAWTEVLAEAYLGAVNRK